MIHGTENTDRPVTRSAAGWRRKSLWLITAGLLAGALFAYPSVSRWARSDRSIDASRVRLATVVRGDLERDVTVDGRVVAANHPTLFSPAAGIVRLEVQPGEQVELGQLLAVIESPELESQLERERSTLLSMRSALERQKLAAKQLGLENAQQVDLRSVQATAAERAMARAERTFNEGVTGAAAHEQAADDLAVARLELEHARQKADLDREQAAFEVRDRQLAVERQQLLASELERQVAELRIRSPVTGLASAAEVEDRDAVAAGQALLRVVDLSAFEVEVSVPESYAGEVTIATAAVVSAGGDHFEAAVRRIAPEVEGSLVAGRVAFTGEPPRGLKQNQRVTTRLILDARHDVLKLQRGPFLESGGGHQAYVLAGDVARPRRIEVGAVSVSEVEVISGLEAGDRVVISDTARFRGADNVLIRH